METESKDAVSEAFKVVPEAYVDLIRRIVPGVVLLAGINSILRPDIRIYLKDIQISVAVIILIVSYCIGLVLDALTDTFTKSLYMWSSWRGFDGQGIEADVIADVLSLKKDEIIPPKRIWQYSKWKLPGLLRMHLMQRDQMVRAVLPKLIAEEFLVRNLSLGLLGLIIAITVGSIFNISGITGLLAKSPKVICSWLLVLSVILVTASFHRSNRTVARTKEWFYLTHRENFKARQALVNLDLTDVPTKPPPPFSKTDAEGGGPAN
jgi:hypothetical protein